MSANQALSVLGANPTGRAGRPSIEALFREYAPELGRYLVAMVRDRALAEDLLQETFYDAVRAQEQLSDIENPRAWLYALARNRALRGLRAHRRLERALASLMQFGDQAHEGSDAIVAVLDLLHRNLSAELRALVLLRYLHGFEAPELAQMTGLSPEAVRQRLGRARAQLLRASQENENREEARQ
jgi:RNA polymerase sigma-70 factor (ECF subfamily)